MARKKKRKKKVFRAVKAVKSAARETLGPTPPTRREDISSRKKQRIEQKHKPTLGRLLSED